MNVKSEEIKQTYDGRVVKRERENTNSSIE